MVWQLFNAVNVETFRVALEDFARSIGAGQGKTVILVLDNAGWHASERITPPNGMRLQFLPPYTPELQPAERLWPLAREALANKSFDSVDDLNDTLPARGLELCAQPDTIRAHTRFGWWPKAA